MRIQSTRRLVVLLAVVALAAPLAFAGDAPSIVGAWDALASTPEGDIPALLTITETDGALEATMEMVGMDRPISDEKLEGDVFTMTVEYDGVPYDVELAVDGDTLEGTYTGSMASGSFTATRQE